MISGTAGAMIEPILLLMALAAGVALGTLYFGGLWWTVARGLASSHPARWFFVSLLLRCAAVMFGFYLVAQGSWQRLAVCLAGFVGVRFIVARLSAAAVPAAQSADSPHAS